MFTSIDLIVSYNNSKTHLVLALSQKPQLCLFLPSFFLSFLVLLHVSYKKEMVLSVYTGEVLGQMSFKALGHLMFVEFLEFA
jgi:hypothetical protein